MVNGKNYKKGREKMDKGKGIVTTVFQNKGFGFIRQDDGTEIYFHASGVCNPESKDLKEGYKVEYMIVEVPKGKKAIGVVTV